MRIEIIKIDGGYIWEAYAPNGASIACGPSTFATRGSARRSLRRLSADIDANGITLVEASQTLCLMDPKEQP